MGKRRAEDEAALYPWKPSAFVGSKFLSPRQKQDTHLAFEGMDGGGALGLRLCLVCEICQIHKRYTNCSFLRLDKFHFAR